ncbi:hypothetical protein SuNHUV7_35790 (plasmid) [Pseudoseohaeicola sp. NH-UV-7]|jgi:hypothetical protein|uniref:hypothetical protein n=1 Tax=unclassified Sulfitobacter TaxID=196795 RepID=UPI000E0AB525|nr:hypothetical protein [Sulfitobacter sp. JL08]AXI54540.1 hypothetical protein C1J05_08570 [Sulfitobacter sp. JL08]
MSQNIPGPTDIVDADRIAQETAGSKIAEPVARPKVRQPLADESAALRDAFLGRGDPADEPPADAVPKSRILSVMSGKLGARKPQPAKATPEPETNPWAQRMKLGKLVFAGLAITYVVMQVPEITQGMAEIAALEAEIDQMQ